MGQRVRPAGRVAGLAALAAALVWAGAADTAAQPPKADPLPIRDAGTTLYLVVRAKPGVQDQEVIDTFKDGLAASRHAIDGDPIIKPVSPAFFEQFAELIGSGTPAVRAAAPQPGKAAIGPLPSREGQLNEIRLPSAKQTMTKFAVKYQPAAGQKDQEEYTPKQPGEGPLTLIEPGRYAFRPPAGRVPTEYTITYDERNDETKQLEKGKEIKDKWPESNKFYVVTMRNFRNIDGGRPNHERFLQVVEQQNENAINPVQISRLGGDQLFVFADMSDDAAEDWDQITIKDQYLNLWRRALPKRNVRRVWMMLPLNEKDYAAAVKKYENIPTRDMPAEVRKNAITNADEAVLKPGAEPKWFELSPDPANPNMFHRRVKMEDIAGLATKYPNMYQITVWEGERIDEAGNPTRAAVRVKSPDGQNVSARGGKIISWGNVVTTIKP